MEKVYGYMIQERLGGNTQPEHAVGWDDVNDAVQEFTFFVINMYKHSECPCTLTLFLGEPQGDEAKYGYPDYPDYVYTGERDPEDEGGSGFIIKEVKV